MDIKFVVGKNGSGKSRHLQRLARETSRETIIICNTVHDRYRATSKIKKFSIRHAKSNPSNVIKSAFIQLAREAGYRLNNIAKVLEYCNYKPRIAFNFIVNPDIDLELSYLQHLGARGKIAEIPDRILNSLTRLLDHGTNFFEVDLVDIYSSSLIQEIILTTLESEKILKRLKLLQSIDVYVQPNEHSQYLRIEQASSGELTLIASQIFTLTNISNGSLVLIDEPENSLHPQWQKDYVDSLGNLISRYAPSVVIATHSPLIVSGIRNSEDLVRFYYAETGKETSPSSHVPSAEESLWEQFETITPESRYVSDHIVDLLESLDSEGKSLSEVIDDLNNMKDASYDYRQAKAIEAAKNLAFKIYSEKRDA